MIYDRLSQAGIIYRLTDDGIGIETVITREKPIPRVLKTDNIAFEYEGENTVKLNRGIRREDTFLFAGVLPCFAMGTVKKDVSGHLPPILGLGEFHFSLLVNGKRFSFDDADRVHAVFRPNGTRWSVSFDALPDLRFCISASLSDGNGIAATVSAEGIPGDCPLTLVCAVEDMRVGDHTPGYFSDNSRRLTPEYRATTDNGGTRHTLLCRCPDPECMHAAAYRFFAAVPSDLTFNPCPTVCVPIQKAGECLTVSGVHAPLRETSVMPEPLADADSIRASVARSEGYYAGLLDTVGLDTPDPLVDAGIRWAALNLDYVHVGPAWLEGGQWWNVHFTNNYQLSAAASIGQYGRTRETLSFFSNLEGGYSVISLTGESLDRWTRKDGRKALGFDGIPYYLWQLWQYVGATGDLDTVRDVAPRIDRMCRELTDVCDPDRDGLLSWNRGVNAFMYQGDHHSVPGAGTSPSVMMAGNLERFSQLLRRAGLTDLSEYWHAVSQKIYRALPRLWDGRRGAFYACVDLSGKPCDTCYYTDFVFPVLYGDDLPIEQKILPLCHLRDRLLYRSPVTGKLLMRVGELKPDLFGNNSIMPVQMAETARAFFSVGDLQTGYDLLASCAYATSVFTENPGSSPEKLNSIGKGEPDYMFGNPAASLVYAAVSGLMGVRLTDSGRTLCFEPGFPLTLPAWHFKLAYAEVSCENTLASDATLDYVIKNTVPDVGIRFGLFIPTGDSPVITVNGKPVSYRAEPALNARKLSFTYTPDAGTDTVVNLRFPAPFTPEAKTLSDGFVNRETTVVQCEQYPTVGNRYRLYLDRDTGAYGVERVTVVPSDKGSGLMTGDLPVSDGYPIDIRDLLNADDIPAFNAWRSGMKYKIRFVNCRREDDLIAVPAGRVTYRCVPVSDLPGAVRTCNLAYGRSDIVGGTVGPSPFPAGAVIPVNRSVGAVSLLYLSETEVRLSGREDVLGRIILRYADGTTVEDPIAPGLNAGSIINNYAQNTVHIPLREYVRDSANHYAMACDPGKVLGEVEIRIDREDTVFGLVGVNVYPPKAPV